MRGTVVRLAVSLTTAVTLAACSSGGGTPASTPTATAARATSTPTATASATSTATATATATASATATATPARAASTSTPAAAAPAATQAPAPAAAPAQPAGPATASVDIVGFAFGSPTVGRGGSVTWLNKDAVQHDVVGPEGTFHSPTLDEGKSFTARFDSAGTFSYYCSIHPFMTAVVTVR